MTDKPARKTTPAQAAAWRELYGDIPVPCLTLAAACIMGGHAPGVLPPRDELPDSPEEVAGFLASLDDAGRAALCERARALMKKYPVATAVAELGQFCGDGGKLA